MRDLTAAETNDRLCAEPGSRRGRYGYSQLHRWEAFTMINHVNFNAPVTGLNSASCGQILAAADPRIVQFALKFAS